MAIFRRLRLWPGWGSPAAERTDKRRPRPSDHYVHSDPSPNASRPGLLEAQTVVDPCLAPVAVIVRAGSRAVRAPPDARPASSVAERGPSTDFDPARVAAMAVTLKAFRCHHRSSRLTPDLTAMATIALVPSASSSTACGLSVRRSRGWSAVHHPRSRETAATRTRPSERSMSGQRTSARATRLTARGRGARGAAECMRAGEWRSSGRGWTGTKPGRTYWGGVV